MKNNKKSPLAAVLVMIIILFAVIYAFFIRPNYYLINGGVVSLDVIFSGDLDRSRGARLETMDDMIYIATREGVTKLSTSGENIWNKSYHFNELLFMEAAPYLAAIDITGKEAYILDENGSVSTISTDYGIVTGGINQEGYLTLITENKNEHYIILYNKEGDMVVKRRTIFEKDGYPLSASMSQDGTKMVTTHLDVSQHMIESVLTFLNYSSVGEEYTDRIVGHERVPETMISKIHFIDNEHVACIGDNLLRFYKVDTIPELLQDYNIQTKIENYAVTSEGIVVTYGDAITVEGEALSHHLVYYSNKGEVIFDKVEGEDVTALCGGDGTFFVIQSSHITKYKKDKVLWETQLNSNPESIYELSGNRYLIVYSNDYEILEQEDI